MKTKDKNKLIEKIIFDKNLGSPHMRILLYAAGAQKKEWTGREIAEKLEMRPQQANLAIAKLRKLGYVKITRKMESGRVLYYSINVEILQNAAN